MAKPCCETGDPKPMPSWKVWMQRALYGILAVIVLILLWKQLHV